MTAVEMMNHMASDAAAAVIVDSERKVRKSRTTDGGAETLPDMGHFVTLVRKIKHRPMVARWLEIFQTDLLQEIDWQHRVAASYLRTVFAVVARLPGISRQRLEQAAERILQLADDYGCGGVKSLLCEEDGPEAEAVKAAHDKFGRSLYLYLQHISDPTDPRFEQAETVRQQKKQWKSEAYASHFRGPKAARFKMDDALENKLKAAIGTIYPQASLEDVVVEHFVRRNLAHSDSVTGEKSDHAAEVSLHTIVVGFNGKETCWDKVVQGVVTTLHDKAMLRIVFSYEPSTGALSVFTEDRAARRDLAKVLRDVVLASEGEIADMPLREFDLNAFGTAKVFDILTTEPGDLVEGVSIQHIKVAKRFEQRDERGTHDLSSGLMVMRDGRDRRNVFTVAYEDYGLDDLTQWTKCQVKLVLRIARQKDRRAHNISVQITVPNGLNDNSKTEEERQLVMRLLKRWHIASEF